MADIDDAASEAPERTSSAEAVCPFLHLEHDPSTSASFVHEAHACFKALPPAPVIARVQERFCLAARYTRCPVYRDEVSRPPRPGLRLPRVDSKQAATLLVFAVMIPAALGAALALLTEDDSPGNAALVTATAIGVVSEQGSPAGSAGGSDGGSVAAVSDAAADGSVEVVAEVEATVLGELRGWSRVAPYDVLPGDTLSNLALIYETTVEAIIAYNGLPDNVIFEGQRIAIPVGFTRSLDEAEAEVVAEAPTSDADPEPVVAPVVEGAAALLAAEQGAIGALRVWPPVVAYTIEDGDSLLAIAAEFATSAEAIAILNDLEGEALFIGRALRIPVGFDVDLTGNGPAIDEPLVLLRNWPSLLEYRVAQGDVLSFIADEFGTTSEAVALYNGLDGNVVVLGQTLIVPINFQVPLPEGVSLRAETDLDVPQGSDRIDVDLLAALLAGVPDDPIVALRLWRDLDIYVPVSGDSLFAIAVDFRTNVDAIRILNRLQPDDFLQVGVPLEVPSGFQRTFEAEP